MITENGLKANKITYRRSIEKGAIPLYFTPVERQQGTVVDINDFGADPTGVNDSFNALQSAINAAEEWGTILLPQGTYLISEPVWPLTGQSFVGDGIDVTYLKLDWDNRANFAGGVTLIMCVREDKYDEQNNLIRAKNPSVIVKDLSIDGSRNQAVFSRTTDITVLNDKDQHISKTYQIGDQVPSRVYVPAIHPTTQDHADKWNAGGYALDENGDILLDDLGNNVYYRSQTKDGPTPLTQLLLDAVPESANWTTVLSLGDPGYLVAQKEITQQDADEHNNLYGYVEGDIDYWVAQDEITEEYATAWNNVHGFTDSRHSGYLYPDDTIEGQNDCPDNWGGGISIGDDWLVENVRFFNINGLKAGIFSVNGSKVIGCQWDNMPATKTDPLVVNGIRSVTSGERDQIQGGAGAANTLIKDCVIRASAVGSAVDFTVADNLNIINTKVYRYSIIFEGCSNSSVIDCYVGPEGGVGGFGGGGGINFKPNTHYASSINEGAYMPRGNRAIGNTVIGNHYGPGVVVVYNDDWGFLNKTYGLEPDSSWKVMDETDPTQPAVDPITGEYVKWISGPSIETADGEKYLIGEDFPVYNPGGDNLVEGNYIEDCKGQGVIVQSLSGRAKNYPDFVVNNVIKNILSGVESTTGVYLAGGTSDKVIGNTFISEKDERVNPTLIDPITGEILDPPDAPLEGETPSTEYLAWLAWETDNRGYNDNMFGVTRVADTAIKSVIGHNTYVGIGSDNEYKEK